MKFEALAYKRDAYHLNFEALAYNKDAYNIMFLIMCRFSLTVF